MQWNLVGLVGSSTLTIGIGTGILATWIGRYGFKDVKHASLDTTSLTILHNWSYAMWIPILALEAGSIAKINDFERVDIGFRTTCLLHGLQVLAFSKGRFFLSSILESAQCWLMFDMYKTVIEEEYLPWFPVRASFALHSGWLFCSTLLNLPIGLQRAQLSTHEHLRLGFFFESMLALATSSISVYFLDPIPVMTASIALFSVSLNRRNVDHSVHHFAEQSELSTLSKFSTILGSVCATVSLGVWYLK